MREYKRIQSLPPDFWSPELLQAFTLWLKDMNQGMRPYTPSTASTFERRFILYTRKGWEEKSHCLALQEVFTI